MGASMRKDSVDPKYLKPHGLYGQLQSWDLRIVRRMIIDKKLAPFYPPREEKGSDLNEETEECPICFMVLRFIERHNILFNFIHLKQANPF
jgi:hypothetical protein